MATVSIFTRGRKLYAKIKDAAGVWRQYATGFDVGLEDEARRWAEDLARQAAAARAAGVEAGPLTVTRYADRWLEQRRGMGHDYKNDSQRLRHHVLPVIGELRLDAVRPQHLIDLVTGLRSSSGLAARTIRNVYAVVSAMFRDARLADLIAQSPAILTADHLGTIADADPTARPDAVYTRAEVSMLIGDDRVPLDRRLVYALGALAGLRHGELAALRWRHYDPAREPLGQLVIANSNDRDRTKTGAVRRIPVLPPLAALLATWRLSGWAAAQGRVPGPDDLLVPLEPDPPNKQARPNPRARGMRSSHDTESRRLRDLAALGLRRRTTHDLRATFITLAEDAGVPPHVVRQLTHPGRSRDAYQGYSRPAWETLCRELGRLVIDRRPDAIVTRLPIAAAASSSGGADDLGAVVVQPDRVPEKTKSHPALQGGSWRSGRDSNPSASPRGDTPSQQIRAVKVPQVPPSTTATCPTAPSLGAVATDCDRALAALRAGEPKPDDGSR